MQESASVAGSLRLRNRRHCPKEETEGCGKRNWKTVWGPEHHLPLKDPIHSLPLVKQFTLHFFLKKDFILFILKSKLPNQREGYGGKDREILYIPGSPPKWLRQPEHCLSKARSQGHLLGVPCGIMGPRAWEILNCLTRNVNRELHWK